MFVRFVTSRWDGLARTRAGFFRDAYDLSRRADVPEWQRQELGREIAWFGQNLAVPRVLHRATGHHQARNGVCWFRDDAAEHVSHARYVVWLLGENGIAVEELRARDPGTAIWADDHQVVTLADRRRPRLLH